MAAAPHRLRVAKILLWTALLVMAIAQCLPWELLEVKLVDHPSFRWMAFAEPSFSQIPHYHRFTTKGGEESHRVYAHYTQQVHLFTSTIHPKGIPTQVRIYHARDLLDYAMQVIEASHGPAFLSRIGWPFLDLVAWLFAFIVIPTLPFLAAPLSRARPLLWLTRFFACSMLVWLIRNLVLVLSGYPDARIENVGSGYWLSMVSLAAVITALFLLPDPRPPQKLQTQ